MAFLVIILSERGRNNLGRVGATFCLFLVLLGLTIVGLAFNIRAHVQQKLHLLDNYNGDGFMYFLVVVGCLVATVHAVGIKVFVDLGSYGSRFRWENQTRLYGVVILVVMFILFCAVIVVFTHQLTMRKHFETGLKSAMDRYSKSAEIKKTFDEMQLEFSCCGNKEPSDWFSVAWIDNSYLDLHSPEIKKALKDGVYKGENVPFSCCSTKILRPCIHRNVTGNHSNYSWPKDSTLNGIGCSIALAAEFGKITLNVAGYIITVAYIFMWFTLIILKLLSTAISNTYPWGDPEGEAPTWLFETCPIGFCNGETPEPPDDVPPAMPGDTPSNKNRNPKKDQAEKDEDADDQDESDQDDAPLLKQKSSKPAAGNSVVTKVPASTNKTKSIKPAQNSAGRRKDIADDDDAITATEPVTDDELSDENETETLDDGSADVAVGGGGDGGSGRGGGGNDGTADALNGKNNKKDDKAGEKDGKKDIKDKPDKGKKKGDENDSKKEKGKGENKSKDEKKGKSVNNSKDKNKKGASNKGSKKKKPKKSQAKKKTKTKKRK